MRNKSMKPWASKLQMRGLADVGSPPETLVPEIPPEVEEGMEATAIPVDDNEATEPLFFYDRDNPDMFVGTLYPSMPEFKLAVKQHSIVKEFELGTEKSDPKRFRGFCKSKDASVLLELELREITVSGYILLTIFYSRTCHCF
jgi:hypothetical protein